MSKVEITTYDDVGRLLVAKTVEDTTLERPDLPPYVMGFHDQLDNYVEDGKVKKRPKSRAKCRGTTLFNLPDGTTVIINGSTQFQATDSTVELDLPVPGTYVVQCVCFPYTVAEFKIEV